MTFTNCEFNFTVGNAQMKFGKYTRFYNCKFYQTESMQYTQNGQVSFSNDFNGEIYNTTFDINSYVTYGKQQIYENCTFNLSYAFFQTSNRIFWRGCRVNAGTARFSGNGNDIHQLENSVFVINQMQFLGQSSGYMSLQQSSVKTSLLLKYGASGGVDVWLINFPTYEDNIFSCDGVIFGNNATRLQLSTGYAVGTATNTSDYTDAFIACTSSLPSGSFYEKT